MTRSVHVIGGGLAGCEAAWQLARRGVPVVLSEMRPQRTTPAHKTGDLAELVCSNSFRSDVLTNAAGLLKEEMRRFGSLILRSADAARVPAGSALAVDREEFARQVRDGLEKHVEIRQEEVIELPEGIAIIASGPLTSDPLADAIAGFTGQDALYFYDAIAPVVEADTINTDIAFRGSRYNKGDDATGDYLNCPFSEEEYGRFYDALMAAAPATLHEFERDHFFEGCLPIEELARRGRDTLCFGPMKPVGLTDPRTGRRPHAVLQLRQDNRAATHYNLVGFQNHLKFGEQERILRLVPGLEQAEFVRFGQIHRNSFINSPRVLRPTYQTRERATLFFAGQISGVEGYLESAAAGLMAGTSAAALALGKEAVPFPPTTAHGALAHYITEADPEHFVPTNVTFGIFPALADAGRGRRGRRERNRRHGERALADLGGFAASLAMPDHFPVVAAAGDSAAATDAEDSTPMTDPVVAGAEVK